MYNASGCHEIKRMEPTEVVRVYPRHKCSLPLERTFGFSECGKFSQDALWGKWKHGKLLINKPGYYMQYREQKPLFTKSKSSLF